MANQISSDPFAGTSAVQHIKAEAALAKSGAHTQTGAAAPKAIGSTNVSSMFWAMQVLLARGTNAWNFGFPSPVQVFANSQVSVTMTEVDNNNTPFLGPASMQVFNVVPLADGTINVRFNVGWSESIRVLFNFIIVN
jgi:hypothetical protein